MVDLLYECCVSHYPVSGVYLMYTVCQKVDTFPSSDVIGKITTRLGPSQRDHRETKDVISRTQRLLLSNIIRER
jgi:hypothetical protein